MVASRLLGPGDFGLLAFAQSILLLAGFVLQSGVPWTLTRDMVPATTERRAALVRGALLTNTGIALVLGGVIGVLYAAGPFHRGLEAVPVVIAVVAALPLFSVSAVARAAAQGVQAFGRVGVIQTVEVTFKAIVGLALAAIGFGALGAVAGFAVGGLVAAVVGVAIVVTRVPLFGRSLAWPALGTVAPMFGALLGLALILNLDLLAMKLLVTDRAATGQYQAAIILANAPYFLVSSAIVPVLFTRLAVHGRLTETRARVAEALRLAVGLALPVELLLIVVPETVLRLLFPAAYAGAAPILRLMAVGNGALLTVCIVTAAFQAIDRSSEVGRVLLVVVALEVPTLAFVVPSFGAFGAVVTFDIAALASAIVLGVRYVALARVRLAPVAGWLARFGLAVAVGGVIATAAWAVAGVYAGIAAGGLVYYGL
ncbi:MAG TPA: oligosaccharide flippase family protein, partial [Candidatus Dormibacteraeota bacterium]|nr:oligosaccharide flippase family protein [Candidatus Dormibacteraeota bacterium]